MTESWPAFVARVPGVTVHDPLAELLGAPVDGLIHYTYADAGRTAGHSCPTVAGTWLMITAALRQLYLERIATRGGVEVSMPGSPGDRVLGVQASVASLITGAAAEGGFPGLSGHYSRRKLLHWDAELPGEMGFRRVDNGDAVTTAINRPAMPPAATGLAEVVNRSMADPPGNGVRRELQHVWQKRVEAMLTDPATAAALVTVCDWA